VRAQKIVSVKTASINEEIEKLISLILDSDLSNKIKDESIALLRYNIIKEHQVRSYNEGVRPDGLN
jgi:hypothetical protein